MFGQRQPFSLFLKVITTIIFLVFASTVCAQSPIDGFELNATSTVRAIAVQADGKILVGGFFTTLSLNGPAAITRKYIARLNPDGRVDSSFNPTASHAVRAIAVQSDGKILIGGYFTSLSPSGSPIKRNHIARLNPDGSVDTTFDPNANLDVYAIAMQRDEKILIGGNFATLAPNGGPAITRKSIARLNSNGTVDKSFNPNVTTPVNQSRVEAIQVQPEGKILIGGGFNSLAPNGGPSVNRTNIARLNPNGTVDVSFDPSPGGSVEAISLQADGKILFGGWFIEVSPNDGPAVPRNHIARMNANGTLDPSFNLSVDKHVYSITSEADGQIVIGGDFDSVTPVGGAAITRHRIARLKLDGSVDMSFDPNINGGGVFAIAQQPDGQILLGGVILTLSPNGGALVQRNNIARINLDGTVDQTLNIDLKAFAVYAIAAQPDDKVLIGGYFDSIQGVPRNNLARLNADGTLDMQFAPSTDWEVDSIAVQANGKILIAGRFKAVSPNGGAAVPRNHIARLLNDGTLDSSFDPNVNGNSARDPVYAIAPQADGKIIICGQFTNLAPNGGATVARKYLARLNDNGTVDTSFNPNPNDQVDSCMLEDDGRILIAGGFTTLAPNGGPSVIRNHIARLNKDGTVDSSFDPNPNDVVGNMALQADGKILISGTFGSLKPNGGASVKRSGVARLNRDGTVDTFNPADPALDTHINALAIQADGGILMGGKFKSLVDGLSPVSRHHVARFKMDGSIDSFNPNADGYLNSMLVQRDGKIIVSGAFDTFSPAAGTNISRHKFARLSNDTAALQRLSVSKTTITWIREGASPQLTRVTFERSTDGGQTYTFLGAGTRVGTGSNFSLDGMNVPAGQNVLIRARGFYRSGNGGSESITESVKNVYLF
jgi:uncharacterized delta-60 repeat protein